MIKVGLRERAMKGQKLGKFRVWIQDSNQAQDLGSKCGLLSK
jgi:hypothetical protein